MPHYTCCCDCPTVEDLLTSGPVVICHLTLHLQTLDYKSCPRTTIFPYYSFSYFFRHELAWPWSWWSCLRHCYHALAYVPVVYCCLTFVNAPTFISMSIKNLRQISAHKDKKIILHNLHSVFAGKLIDVEPLVRCCHHWHSVSTVSQGRFGGGLLRGPGERVPGCAEWAARGQEPGEVSHGVRKADQRPEEVTREREAADDKMPGAQRRDCVQLGQGGHGTEALSGGPDYYHLPQEGTVGPYPSSPSRSLEESVSNLTWVYSGHSFI